MLTLPLIPGVHGPLLVMKTTSVGAGAEFLLISFNTMTRGYQSSQLHSKTS